MLNLLEPFFAAIGQSSKQTVTMNCDYHFQIAIMKTIYNES